ncbi:hypothetical protein AKJ09_01599 [Labilithrix luteola]|uniref:Uncharacterized protein n=1 Tax=Labilithrix luteola TaxID=1391654 RepID=A0A0K1PN18_9BACT|nr:hypothetical protein [Labilithrix luteola]AKU94935.1 hypothetical protein AKJ09_01599 [Labilithrix luteola]
MCTETPEQRAAANEQSRQSAEREAEARRNAYFESGTDEGGQSLHASSDATHAAQQCPDDPIARFGKRVEAYDRPIQPDPVGNAVAATVVGGLILGPAAAAKNALKLGVEANVPMVLEQTVGKIPGAVLQNAAKAALTEKAKESLAGATQSSQSTPGSPPSASATTTSSKAGWSIGATSAEPPAANQSQSMPAEQPHGQDRVPLAPGQVPFRIPELPQEAVSIKG